MNFLGIMAFYLDKRLCVTIVQCVNYLVMEAHGGGLKGHFVIIKTLEV